MSLQRKALRLAMRSTGLFRKKHLAARYYRKIGRLHSIPAKFNITTESN